MYSMSVTLQSELHFEFLSLKGGGKCHIVANHTAQLFFCFSSYVILTPSSFRSGIPLSISVNILKSTAPVVVTADLISKSGGDHNVASTSGSFNQGKLGLFE